MPTIYNTPLTKKYKWIGNLVMGLVSLVRHLLNWVNFITRKKKELVILNWVLYDSLADILLFFLVTFGVIELGLCCK